MGVNAEYCLQVEFFLNDLDSRLLVQEAIDGVRYYRGSTNTALALQMVREQVFNEQNGDRPRVRNIAVVLTDGGSNNYPDTVSINPAALNLVVHLSAIPAPPAHMAKQVEHPPPILLGRWN